MAGEFILHSRQIPIGFCSPQGIRSRQEGIHTLILGHEGCSSFHGLRVPNLKGEIRIDCIASHKSSDRQPTITVNLSDPVIVNWVFLPLLILGARIAETSLKTIRLVYVAKGFKYLAAGIGTGEVAIWLLSTGLVIINLTNLLAIAAYIAGYAIGTVLGIDLENKLKVGHVVVRIITRIRAEEMMLELREKGYGITRLEGIGSYGSSVAVLLVLVPRNELDDLLGILNEHYPEAIFTIEDIRSLKDNTSLFYKKRKPRILDRLSR